MRSNPKPEAPRRLHFCNKCGAGHLLGAFGEFHHRLPQRQIHASNHEERGRSPAQGTKRQRDGESPERLGVGLLRYSGVGFSVFPVEIDFVPQEISGGIEARLDPVVPFGAGLVGLTLAAQRQRRGIRHHELLPSRLELV